MKPELADAITAWAEENERTPLLAEAVAGFKEKVLATWRAVRE